MPHRLAQFPAVLEVQTGGIDRAGRHPGSRLRMLSMRDDPGLFPTIVLVLLSLTLLVACYFMSQAQQPTESGIDSSAAFGVQLCTSYLGTTFDCP